MIDWSNYIAIDLTLSFDQDIAGFSSEDAKRLEEDGWNASMLHIYSHSGTHIDAPKHFGLKGTIDEFKPSQLMGKAWIADLIGIQASELITPVHLAALSEQIKPGDNLILRTGWSKHLNNRELYRNQLPRISKDLAHWLVEKGVNMLGVEPPSVADVNNLEEVTRIHEILLRGNIIIIEGLTNLDQISSNQVWLMAFPLKIKHGDGAPARVVALV